MGSFRVSHAIARHRAIVLTFLYARSSPTQKYIRHRLRRVMFSCCLQWNITLCLLEYIMLRLPRPLKTAPCCGDLDPFLVHGSLGPPESSPHMACQLVQLFLHSSSQSVPILCNWPPLPPPKKNVSSPRGIREPI